MDPLAFLILAVCAAILIYMQAHEQRDQYSSDNPPAWVEVDASEDD